MSDDDEPPVTADDDGSFQEEQEEETMQSGREDDAGDDAAGVEDDDDESTEGGAEPATKRPRSTAGEGEEEEKGGDPEDASIIPASSVDVPEWVALVTLKGYAAKGGPLLLAMFEPGNRAHPLVRHITQRICRFVHAGKGQWYVNPSVDAPASGGVIGVWSTQGGMDALADYVGRWATEVLELSEIEKFIHDYSDEKRLHAKCLKQFNFENAMRHVKCLQGPSYGLTTYDFELRLDQNHLLTCFSEGMVFDAGNGTICQAEPDDFISRTLGVAWSAVQAVTSDAADQFTTTILEPMFTRPDMPDGETLGSVLDIMALMVLGYAKRTEKFLIFYGSGRNGKSMIVDLLSCLLGSESLFTAVDHAYVTSEHKTTKGSADAYLAGTNGTRMVSMTELPKGAKLQWDSMKMFSSNDKIKARNLYQGRDAADRKAMSFNRTFWPVLSTNYQPSINGLGSQEEADQSIKDRVVLVHFPNNFKDPEAENYVAPPNPNPVANPGFADNHTAVFMKVLHRRWLGMRARSEAQRGPRIVHGGELLPFGLSDMSTRIQQVTNEWRDKLFESNNGSLCPLNDYEMQRFEQQLAAISNFEDMSGHPKERGRQIAGLYVNLAVLKHRIFGKKHDARQGSMVPYSSAPVGDDHTTALLKHSRNNGTRFEWQKITEEGYELIVKELGLKKVTAYSGQRDGDARGTCMSGWAKKTAMPDGSEKECWLVLNGG